jgi:hypothetical protein
LNNPDKLLTRVVEVKFDLVGRRTDRLIASELELLEEVFVGVLGHLTALISVEEDVVNVEGGSNKRLLVGIGDRDGSVAGVAAKLGNSPEALADRAEVEVDLDLVVLEGNKREGKSRVTAEPELKRDIKGGLREGVTGGAHLGRTSGSGTRSVDIGEIGLGHVGKLSGVSNHLEVTTLLLGRESHLIPDMHPVAILAIDALSSDLDLNLSDKLLSDVI